MDTNEHDRPQPTDPPPPYRLRDTPVTVVPTPSTQSTRPARSEEAEFTMVSALAITAYITAYSNLRASDDQIDHEATSVAEAAFKDNWGCGTESAGKYWLQFSDTKLQKLQDLLYQYKIKIHRSVLCGKAVAPEALRGAHESLKETVLDNVPPSLQVDDVDRLLEAAYSRFCTSNESNWKSVAEQVSVQIKDLCKKFRKGLNDFKSPGTASKSAAFNAHAQKLQTIACEELEDTLRSLTDDDDYVTEQVGNLEKRSKELKAKQIKFITLMEAEDNAMIDAAIQVVKKELRQAMDVQMKKWRDLVKDDSSEVPTSDVLRKSFEATLTSAIVASRAKVKLTSDHETEVRQAMTPVLHHYENEIKLWFQSYKVSTIGIDLGTTYSCVAVYRNGGVVIIPEKSTGKKTIASHVLFKPDGSVIVGNKAKEDSFKDPENTIYDAKRLIGRRFNEKTVKEDIPKWPFEVVDRFDEPRINVHGKEYQPESVSTKLLEYLRDLAQTYLGHEVTKVYVTVPAHFNDSQRRGTLEAALAAGFKEVNLLSEPSAAAIAYNLSQTGDRKRNVLIFDLGGGTFDVSVLEFNKGELDERARDGDTHLGGEDFDNRMVNQILNWLEVTHTVKINDDKLSQNKDVRKEANSRLRRLKVKCEEAKKELSQNNVFQAAIEIEGFHPKLPESKLKFTFTRDEFNRINKPDYDKIITILERVIKSAEMKVDEITDVVLVGGSSNIPEVQERVRKLFKNKPIFNSQLNPDEAVARGAAYYAAVNDINSNATCGVGGSGASDIPVFKLVHEITPHTFSVEVSDGSLSPIISKGTTIPCTRKQHRYTTVYDNQTTADIVVYEGEHLASAKNLDNRKLGRFKLVGIPPAPAGKSKLIVYMHIDTQNLLHVKGEVEANGITQSIIIERHTGGPKFRNRIQ